MMAVKTTCTRTVIALFVDVDDSYDDSQDSGNYNEDNAVMTIERTTLEI